MGVTPDRPDRFRGRRLLALFFLPTCFVVTLILVAWYNKESLHERFPQPFCQNKGPSSPRPKTVVSTGLQSDIPVSRDEWASIQHALRWQDPDRPITNLAMSTSPTHTRFFIQGLKESYHVGDELNVTIAAKDFKNNSKQYGGDFFQAKLFSTSLKASVFGEVIDHQSGTYSVRLLLPWVGQAQVAIRLIHSSEAVQALKHHREKDGDKVFFQGYFERTGPSGTKEREVVECNVKWDKYGLERIAVKNCCCEYKDIPTGEVWRCKRPKVLPCNALVYHSAGGYRNPLTPFESKLLAGDLTNKYINGDTRLINIVPANGSFGVIEKCKPGMPTPAPAGYYLKDVWTSLVCSTHQFTITEMTDCLKNKHIYMMGDSTMRQWYEYLLRAMPTLTAMNLHGQAQVGPLLAVDVKNNIDLHWRAHGPPLRCFKAPFVDLHYISNEMDDLAGGPHSVIVFNVGPHFTTFPIEIFVRRVARIRTAILALLRRAPDTTVMIKTVNTGYKDVYGSDWLSLQLDRILRRMFQDVPVAVLDVWQMTACHYSREQIHPTPVIIENEINMFLSFICPK